MNDTVDVWMVIKDLVDGSLIAHIDIVEVGPLAAYQFDAVERFFGRIVEIVEDNDFVVCLEQGKGSERANVAGATTIKPISKVPAEIEAVDRAHPVMRTEPTVIVASNLGWANAR